MRATPPTAALVERDTAIIAAYLGGESPEQLGIAYGITRKQVMQVLKRPHPGPAKCSPEPARDTGIVAIGGGPTRRR
jgi:hypothetical protein